MNQNRVQAGVPAGGQFAPSSTPEQHDELAATAEWDDSVRWTTWDDVRDQEVVRALGDNAADFDVDAITDEAFEYHVPTNASGNELVAEAGYRQKVSTEEFWRIAEKHQMRDDAGRLLKLPTPSSSYDVEWDYDEDREENYIELAGEAAEQVRLALGPDEVRPGAFTRIVSRITYTDEAREEGLDGAEDWDSPVWSMQYEIECGHKRHVSFVDAQDHEDWDEGTDVNGEVLAWAVQDIERLREKRDGARAK